MSTTQRPKRAKEKDPTNFSGLDNEIDDDRDSTFECSSRDFYSDSDDSYSAEMKKNYNKKSTAAPSSSSSTASRMF